MASTQICGLLRELQVTQRQLIRITKGSVRILGETGRDFTERGEGFFLAIEGHRVRYAYRFDPCMQSMQIMDLRYCRYPRRLATVRTPPCIDWNLA